LRSRKPKDGDVKRYSEQMANDPDSLAFVPLAELYRANGMVDQAIHMCLQGLQRHPENAEARILLAACLADSGKTKEAGRHLKGVLKLVPNNKKAKAALRELMETGSIGQLGETEPPEEEEPETPAPKTRRPSPPAEEKEELFDFEGLFGEEDEEEEEEELPEEAEEEGVDFLDDLKLELDAEESEEEEEDEEETEEGDPDDLSDLDRLLDLGGTLDAEEEEEDEEEDEDFDFLSEIEGEEEPEEAVAEEEPEEEEYDFSFLRDLEDDGEEEEIEAEEPMEEDLEVLSEIEAQPAPEATDQEEEADLDFLADLDLQDMEEVPAVKGEPADSAEEQEAEEEREDLDFLGDLDLEGLDEESEQTELPLVETPEEAPVGEEERFLEEEEEDQEEIPLPLAEEEEAEEQQERAQEEAAWVALEGAEDKLDAILKALSAPDEVMGSMVVGSDGFVVASYLKQDMELEKMAALLASIIETADRSTRRMKLGAFRGILVETDQGTIHLSNRFGITLVVLSDAEARLGLIRIRMQNALDALSEYLS